ncbi:proline-specific permease [[Candida] railenensis]|uniref:Proline-specific permease n=1 Tax=[Candida] railenensis TaxID=45579 RepID=A0A9P0QN46_9ASCO|nr:proline-specific permease [[Candida] railenensis]
MGKDIFTVKSAGSQHRPGIYRSNSSHYAISIANSRIVPYDEKGNPLSPDNSQDAFDPETLERGLKSRHVQLIALGGCIGTGLFVGTGSALSACGPAPLLISYMIMSIVMFFVMNMLGEMTTFLPLPGNGPQAFVTNYFDSSLGFATGWNYWYAFAMLVASEVTAASIVIQYWTTKVNVAVWITILLIVIIALNMSSVKYFGEAEFWFASIKLIAITGLIIVGIVIFFGGAPTHDRLGFRYWQRPGAFTEHLTEGNTGKFLAVWTAIIKSGFAFICSPELVSVCGAESVAPRRNIPKAANRFIYRLAFFYIMGTLVIGVIVAYTNDRLLNGSSDASASPFVIGIQNAGIKVLNHIVNAVILTSAASAGNSFLYSSSRTLFGLATNGLAPKIFTTVNRMGVPYYAVAASCLLGFLSYLNVSSGGANVFTWFSNICTISGFISWLAVTLAYIRWRKAIAYHGLSERVTYKTILQPYGAYFVLIFIGLVTITNGYAVFFDFKASDFIAAYITLPIFLVLYVGHKLYNYFALGKTEFVIPLEQIDLITGLDLIEEEERMTPERLPSNFMEKIWYWIA